MKNSFKILILFLVITLGLLVFFFNKGLKFFSENLFLASPQGFLEIEIIGDGGFGNSLALTPWRSPAVSFLNEEKGLIFTEEIDGKWEGEVVDAGALAGHETSLAFDKAGRPNILYIDKNFSLKLATKVNENWEIEKIFNGAALSLNLIFDREGSPNISFWSASKGALAFGKKIDSKWDIEIVESGKVGWWNDLVLDKNQNPHISYFDFKNKDLLYTSLNKNRWRKEIVDFEEDVGRWNSIVLDKEDKPHISYFDEGNGDLKYAKKGKGGWEIEGIDKAGAVGERTNIAIDQNDNLFISYFDLSNNDFKLAQKDDKGWHNWLIDLKGDVGGDNSLLIDKENNIFLLWQDLLQGRLKYSIWRK